MSHLMTALAMQVKGLKPATKIVLYWLADHHNGETGMCCPSLNTLASECEMTRATVVSHIEKLEALGVVEKVHRVRENGSTTSTKYVLNINEIGCSNSKQGLFKNYTGPVQNFDPHNLGNRTLEREPKSYTRDFEDFWSVYPGRPTKSGRTSKGSKADAFTAWKTAIKKTTPENLINAAKEYQDDARVKRGAAKDAVRWLRKECWLEEIETGNFGGGQNQANGQSALSAAFAGFGGPVDQGHGGSGDCPWDTARDVTPADERADGGASGYSGQLLPRHD